eukprot:TRINITY_DN30811_c0_g1_i1.p2 TRINITY_DN30811_c0_g1~~TRINITY_DN30811_c0_g1_i1.p2  ORF type:complete len:112 (-),score=10.63 TRINITY_DN30811_c0_g1_i1:199-534(-)
MNRTGRQPVFSPSGRVEQLLVKASMTTDLELFVVSWPLSQNMCRFLLLDHGIIAVVSAAQNFGNHLFPQRYEGLLTQKTYGSRRQRSCTSTTPVYLGPFVCRLWEYRYATT